MDLSINGIHYIKLDQIIPKHIKKCNSIEFQQTIEWFIAHHEPVNTDDLHNLLIIVLNKMAKNESMTW